MRGRAVLAALVCGGFLLASGCFFVRAPVAIGPALVVGHVLGGVGEPVEIPIEVLDFPRPVAGVAVLGLSYDPQVLELSDLEGKNGFVVLCRCFDNARGLVKFIAVNPNAGIASGSVVILRGIRVGPGDPRFALSAFQIVDEANTLIPAGEFALRLGGAPLYGVRRSSGP
ncbi:MAG: hypothetical protein ACPLRP_04505 [Candidatus Bipolaricaulaceae bacterium]